MQIADMSICSTCSPPLGATPASASARCSAIRRPQASSIVQPAGRDSMRARPAARASCGVSGLQGNPRWLTSVTMNCSVAGRQGVDVRESSRHAASPAAISYTLYTTTNLHFTFDHVTLHTPQHRVLMWAFCRLCNAKCITDQGVRRGRLRHLHPSHGRSAGAWRGSGGREAHRKAAILVETSAYSGSSWRAPLSEGHGWGIGDENVGERTGRRPSW